MELMKIKTYQEFNEAFGLEVRKQSEGFIRIGYLLKRARDTDILSESGYKTIAEYAWAEYRFSDDVVSRMIRINDRYSVDGYSDQLQDKYKAYGMSLLAEMLTLPEEVVDLLPPGITRQEIRQIKAEIREEEKITDLEVLIEGEKLEQKMMESKLERFFYQYYHDNRIQYEDVYDSIQKGEDKISQVYETLAPSGIATMITRIQGTGKYMLSIKGKESELELLNIRDNSKDTFSWEECITALTKLCPAGGQPEKAWEALYGEPFSEAVQEAPPAPEPKPEIAPAQKDIQQPEKRDESPIHDKEPEGSQALESCLDECCTSECRPQEASNQEPEQPEFAPAQPEPEKETDTLKEPEVVKQMDVEDYEELLPEGYIKCHDGSQVSEERIRTRYEALAAAESIVEMAEILNQADDRDWYLWLEERDGREMQ